MKNVRPLFANKTPFVPGEKVTPLELTTKLMEAAKDKGAELRIATVSKVATSPVEAAEGKGEQEGERDQRVTAVVLEDGEEIPCDRVRYTSDNWLV